MAVILAPNGKPAGPANPIDVKVPIFVARDADTPIIGICNVCRDRGEHSVFYEGEEVAFNRHLAHCSDRHQEAAQKTTLRHKNPALFDPDQAGDVDLERWMRHNGRAIMEGRLKP